MDHVGDACLNIDHVGDLCWTLVIQHYQFANWPLAVFRVLSFRFLSDCKTDHVFNCEKLQSIVYLQFEIDQLLNIDQLYEHWNSVCWSWAWATCWTNIDICSCVLDYNYLLIKPMNIKAFANAIIVCVRARARACVWTFNNWNVDSNPNKKPLMYSTNWCIAQ